MNDITYRYGNDLDLDQVIELYRASTLGERRPVDNRAIMAEMIKHANLVVTGWDGDLLVGIARTLTDFSYIGYLADLAVRASHQRQGIGVELIQKTRDKMGARSMLVLLAAPKAVDYYPKIGFTKHDSAWTLRASEPVIDHRYTAETRRRLPVFRGFGYNSPFGKARGFATNAQG